MNKIKFTSKIKLIWKTRIEQQVTVLESGDLLKQISHLAEWTCAFWHTRSHKFAFNVLTKTHGHSFKLYAETSRVNVRHDFLRNSVVNA